MKQTKYRVETFIIPLCNSPVISATTRGQADDAKVEGVQQAGCFRETLTFQKLLCSKAKNAAKLVENQAAECVDGTTSFQKLVCCEMKNDAFSSEDETLQNLRNYMKDGNIAQNSVERQVTGCTPNRYDRCSQSVATKIKSQLSEFQTLISIDEKSEESDDRFADLCYHGCKNGCSATVPTPQEVSEEVFHENWLQKLEVIKQKESALKAKELVLQKRERELFKRERDIRIMERVLKEKTKRAELFFRETKNLQTLLNAKGTQEGSLPSKSDPNVHELQDNKHVSGRMLVTSKSCDADIFKNESSLQDSKKERECPNRPQKSPDTISTSPKEFRAKKTSQSTSTSSSETASSEDKTTRRLSTLRSSTTSNLCQFTNSKATSINSKRRKPCKIYYEDLDTTLSADIGDSSFVQTSEKFNPALYRRPFSFARSHSERRPRRSESRDCVKVDVQSSCKDIFGCPSGIEQDRVLKRVTDNISASREQGTKFQHYGLIDLNVNTANKAEESENRLKEDKKYSYLDLETGSKMSPQKGVKGIKDRPISWNEGTNEWLRKKRQVYNTAARKIIAQNFEDKENSEKCNTKINKPEKLTKKKDIKNKIFTVFW